ncbi:MAG: preprotein translocase subunit YajC [Planctomycetota bacterium]|jgi:preprotein translocase subunit YajC
MTNLLFWFLAEGDAPGAGAGSLFVQLAPFLVILVIFYLLLIRPQMKREKDRQSMLRELKKNDKVVTQSGILGTVIQMKEPWVVLRVDDNKDVRVKVLLNSVSGMAPGSEPADEKKGEK